MPDKIFPVPKKSNLIPLISDEKYSELYKLSIDNPNEFWGEQALSRLSWIKPFDDVLFTNMEKAEFEWFSNGKLNACFNCVDKHLEIMAITSLSFGKVTMAAHLKKLLTRNYMKRSVDYLIYLNQEE